MQIAFAQCNNPRSIETGLLDDYFDEHWELPPFNRSN
jgi:hypothetical protein